MKALLDSYVKSGKELQVKFCNDPGPPVGPSKIEIVEVPATHPGPPTAFYRMRAPAMIPGPPGAPPKQTHIPVVFAAESVLWVTEGPEEESRVQTIGGRTSPGGIHIG